jgi:uncharacterized tellurite resistance protein B-like protein
MVNEDSAALLQGSTSVMGPAPQRLARRFISSTSPGGPPALAKTPNRVGLPVLDPPCYATMMIEGIMGWLTGTPAPADSPLADELKLALAALLAEAAHSHEHFDESERAVVARLLQRRFNLSPADARALLAAGERESNRSAELFHLTRIVNERLSAEQRVELIEMLWEVAYTDGVLDEYEDSLLRRVGGLIYVPDRERGMARQRVLRRLGLGESG